MRRRVLFLLLLGVFLMSSVAVADGFYVVGGGGGVGTKITSLPFPINSPGFYYLTKDLDYSGSGNGIDVNVDDVTIDLMGFRLRNTGEGWGGIHLNSHQNVEIRNGSFSGWDNAIFDASGGRNRAFNIRVKNGANGIEFYGTGNLIKGCTSETTNNGIVCYGGVVSGNAVANNNFGISVLNATVSGNSAINCSGEGIHCDGASTIIHNTIVTTAIGQIGIRIMTGEPVLVMQNTASGPGTRLSPDSGTVNISNAGF